MAFLKLKDREVNMINNVDSYTIPIIYQSGYLTIKSYDERFKIYHLCFPNQEVEEGFQNILLPQYSSAGEHSYNIVLIHK